MSRYRQPQHYSDYHPQVANENMPKLLKNHPTLEELEMAILQVVVRHYEAGVL